MGIDAALFSNDNQMFYYDREYNLKPLDFYSDLMGLWSSLNGGGISKEEMLYYMRKLKSDAGPSEWQCEGIEQHSELMRQQADEWVKSLPDAVSIVSRNDADEEYHEFRKKCDEVREIKMELEING